MQVMSAMNEPRVTDQFYRPSSFRRRANVGSFYHCKFLCESWHTVLPETHFQQVCCHKAVNGLLNRRSSEPVEQCCIDVFKHMALFSTPFPKPQTLNPTTLKPDNRQPYAPRKCGRRGCDQTWISTRPLFCPSGPT